MHVQYQWPHSQLPTSMYGYTSMAAEVISCCTHRWVELGNVCMHERSVIETRQSKAATPENNSLFLKRKRRAASGRIQTHTCMHDVCHCTVYTHVWPITRMLHCTQPIAVSSCLRVVLPVSAAILMRCISCCVWRWPDRVAGVVVWCIVW